MKSKCKVEDCSRPSIKDGFCGWCLKKHIVGKYDHFGALSLKEQIKLNQKISKQKNKEKKEKQAQIDLKKKDIKGRLTTGLLKVLQEDNADLKKTFYCNKLDFFSSEAVCFARMFIFEKPKECMKCNVHDLKLDGIIEVLKLKEDKK